MPTVARPRRTFPYALLSAAVLLTLAAVSVQPTFASSNSPRIEGLRLGMSPAEIMRASRRPCSVRPFLPSIRGIVCAAPGQPDVSLAAGLTQTQQPEQVFALLLSFCSRRGFADLISDTQGRYGIGLGTRAASSDHSRGAWIGRDLILALSQHGVCADGEAKFNLMLGDRQKFAAETALSAPLPSTDHMREDR